MLSKETAAPSNQNFESERPAGVKKSAKIEIPFQKLPFMENVIPWTSS